MKDFGEFDYVIVGAGAAGCVLANRLSADHIGTNIFHPVGTCKMGRDDDITAVVSGG